MYTYVPWRKTWKLKDQEVREAFCRDLERRCVAEHAAIDESVGEQHGALKTNLLSATEIYCMVGQGAQDTR